MLHFAEIIYIVLDIETIGQDIFVFAYHCVGYFGFVALDDGGQFLQEFEGLLVGGYDRLRLDWD